MTPTGSSKYLLDFFGLLDAAALHGAGVAEVCSMSGRPADDVSNILSIPHMVMTHILDRTRIHEYRRITLQFTHFDMK